MSNHTRGIQIVDHHEHNDYEKLQAVIRAKAGVDCSIFVTSECISIRAASYADFVLAKSAIKGMTSLPIIQDKS